jgi:predicted PurR-regulated permease PerM
MSEEPAAQARRSPGLTPVRLLIILLIFYLLVQVKVVLLLVLLALLFATAIEVPVRRFERRGMPRSASILTVYALILLVLAILLAVFVPVLGRETRAFADQAPDIVDRLSNDWRSSGNPFLSGIGLTLLDRARAWLNNPPAPKGGTALGLIGGAAAGGLGIVSMFVIGFYWLMEKRWVRRLVVSDFEPERAERIIRVWQNVEAKLGDWMRGQFILCLIIGTAAGTAYAILGVRFWILLAVLAGITELMPIIGPWIGGIPAVMMALLDSWQKALAVAVFLGLLQLTENAILVPRVMKGAIGLSPLTVFIAVLAGGEFMGPLGALLAIPFAAALQVIIGDAVTERQQRIRRVRAASTNSALESWLDGDDMTEREGSPLPDADGGGDGAAAAEAEARAATARRHAERGDEP